MAERVDDQTLNRLNDELSIEIRTRIRAVYHDAQALDGFWARYLDMKDFNLKLANNPYDATTSALKAFWRGLDLGSGRMGLEEVFRDMQRPLSERPRNT